MTGGMNVSFDRDAMETPPVPSSESMTFDNSEYSPTPGADMSSYSSPGSASDHMGASYGTSISTQQPAPMYPGSAALSAFDKQSKQQQQGGGGSSSHVNRVITTTTASTTAASDPDQPEPPQAPGTTKKAPERRQKRLERNRESARLSRRRRKQYLELLEQRVHQMGSDLDRLRRAHCAEALSALAQQRAQQIAAGLPDENVVGRCAVEIMLVNTFQGQQLRSFAVPPSTQFVLWLTLQNDQYFRGGRAASERLSAARIGERVSHIVCVEL